MAAGSLHLLCEFLHPSGRFLHSSGRFIHPVGRFFDPLDVFLHSLALFLHASGGFLHCMGRFLHPSLGMVSWTGKVQPRASIHRSSPTKLSSAMEEAGLTSTLLWVLLTGWDLGAGLSPGNRHPSTMGFMCLQLLHQSTDSTCHQARKIHMQSSFHP